jgi:hypothetical protein
MSVTSILFETFTIDPSRRLMASAIGQRLETLKHVLLGATSLLDDVTKRRMRTRTRDKILVFAGFVMTFTVIEAVVRDMITASTVDLGLSSAEAVCLFDGLIGYSVI